MGIHFLLSIHVINNNNNNNNNKKKKKKKNRAGLELESLAQKSIALTNRLGKPLILPVYQNDT